MLHRFELLTNLDNLVHRYAHFQAHSHSTENIFIVMLSQQMHILGGEKLLLLIRLLIIEGISSQEKRLLFLGILRLFLGRKP